jgi:phosphatidate cytidylyltransferase
LEPLKRVLTALVLIPVVIGLVLRAPIPLLAFVAGAVALAAIHELLALADRYGFRPARVAIYVFVGAFFLLIALGDEATPLVSTSLFTLAGISAAMLAPFLFLSLAMSSDELRSAFPAALLSAFAFAYVALPLASLVELREQWRGSFLLLYLLIVVWAGDIFAYFVGASIGRHRMSPRVSPKKTWEGAVASLLASVAAGVVLFHYAVPISVSLLNAHVIERRDGIFAGHQLSLASVVLLSAAINVAAQLGDLVESVIKRGAGAKDSGSILPGHGGMLDRIDALLFAAPVLWFYAAWKALAG